MSNPTNIADTTSGLGTAELKAKIKAEFAQAAEDIEARHTELADDPQAAKAVLTDVLRASADHRAGGQSDFRPAPLSLDFDAQPEAPEWVVCNLIERGTVVLLSGDTGAAKSICVDALTVAVCHDDDWLGHETVGQRVLVVDEENSDRLVRDRLRALGMENERRDRLRYFSREGFSLGDEGGSDAAIRHQLGDFRPDLVIVDTAMAACDLEDVNSNSEAVRLLKFMRGLAREHDCAFLLLHHERKRSKEHPASSGQAMMGARQWAGQADAHMTLTVESEMLVEDADEDGHRRFSRTFKWRPAEKDRDGRPNIPQRVAVKSEKDADGALCWMLVENEGDIQEADTARDALAGTLGSLVQDNGQVTTSGLASLAQSDAQDSTFKRALKAAEAAGYIEKVKRGTWGPGDQPVIAP